MFHSRVMAHLPSSFICFIAVLFRISFSTRLLALEMNDHWILFWISLCKRLPSWQMRNWWNLLLIPNLIDFLLHKWVTGKFFCKLVYRTDCVPYKWVSSRFCANEFISLLPLQMSTGLVLPWISLYGRLVPQQMSNQQVLIWITMLDQQFVLKLIT